MIRLAFSSNAFKKNTLTEAVDAIGDAGYAGVELMADVPHAHPARFDSAQRETLKRQLADRCLVVSNVNAFTHFAEGDTYRPTWIDRDPAKREVRIQHTIAAVELAAEFSAGTVSIQPGGPMIGSTIAYPEALQLFAEGLQRVIPRAKDLGVVIAVEPEPGLLIEMAAEYAAFKHDHFAGESTIAMNCDVGHLFCVGDDPVAVIREQADQVAHVHLEDIGANRVHQHLLPGKGVIDFRAIFDALKSIGYRGWTTVELYPFETTATETAKRAMEHLRPIIRSV